MNKIACWYLSFTNFDNLKFGFDALTHIDNMRN